MTHYISQNPFHRTCLDLSRLCLCVGVDHRGDRRGDNDSKSNSSPVGESGCCCACYSKHNMCVRHVASWSSEATAGEESQYFCFSAQDFFLFGSSESERKMVRGLDFQ